MREAGHKAVEVEPQLQNLTGEVFEYKSANKQDDARSDIKVCGFWTSMRQAYFDVKVVSPLARSYARLSMTQLYRNAEKSKEREYSQRIREVEHGDFNPLVFTTAGGAAPQSTRVIKHLAAKISEKQGVHRSKATAGYAADSVSHCFEPPYYACAGPGGRNQSLGMPISSSL